MFDIETARERLGIANTQQDAQIRTAGNAALALCEQYCDRAFMFASETARFIRPTSARLLLRRYPVARILSIQWERGTLPPYAPTYELHHEAGIVVLSWSGPLAYTSEDAGKGYAPVLSVAYEGGYPVLPADLELALWMAFDAVWLATPGAGAPTGATSGQSERVRSFAIDGMSLTYSDAGKGNASGHDGGAWGLLPPATIAALDPYRAETVAGGV